MDRRGRRRRPARLGFPGCLGREAGQPVATMEEGPKAEVGLPAGEEEGVQLVGHLVHGPHRVQGCK